MKRSALILVMLMMIPAAAFGMQTLNNGSMDKITGQSGVSIAVDDVQAFMHIDRIAYIDSDGVSTSVAPSSGFGTTAGALAINNFTLNLININAIIGTGTALAGSANANYGNGIQSGPNMALASSGSIPLFYNYATSATSASYLNTGGTTAYGLQSSTYINPMTGQHAANIEPRFSTIDVSNDLPCATAAIRYLTGSTAATYGGVIIGLPTMELYVNNLMLTPYYTGLVNGNTAVTAVNDFANGATYGTVQIQGITSTTLSGWIEVAPH